MFVRNAGFPLTSKNRVFRFYTFRQKADPMAMFSWDFMDLWQFTGPEVVSTVENVAYSVHEITFCILWRKYGKYRDFMKIP